MICLCMAGAEKTSVEFCDEILPRENLNKAYFQVYSNKGTKGVDRVTVDELKQYLKENMVNCQLCMTEGLIRTKFPT